MRTKILLFSVIPLLLFATMAYGQVTGVVVDDFGPISDAQINVVDKDEAATTAEDGSFTIQAEIGDQLIITNPSTLSQKTFSVAKLNLGELVISETIALTEVVQMGYRELSKNDQTGSVFQLNSEELEKVQLASVDQALQGKVTGLNISASSGTPGSNQEILIRGFGSMSASNAPLFVIDGVPMSEQNPGTNVTGVSSLSPLSLLNSNDVASVTVLKDASATAAYGARGSNGVIVITTKKGSKGKTKFSLSTQYGWSDYAVEQPTPLSGAQREQLFYDALFNTYGADLGFTRAQAQQFYESHTVANSDGITFPDTYVQWNEDGRPDPNWSESLKNSYAPVHNYNLSASGGSAKESFYASLGYYQNEAVVKGGDFERISARLNYNRDFSDRVKFQTSNQFGLGTQDGILEQNAYFANPFSTRYFMPPIEPIFNEDGSYNTNTSEFNVLYLAENDIRERESLRLLNNTSLNYEFIKNVTFKTIASFDYVNEAYHNYQNRHHGDGEDSNGYAYQSINRRFNWVTQNSLAYNNKFGNHKVDFLFVQEYQKFKENWLGAEGSNFPKDGYYYLDNTSAEPGVYGWFEDYANASYSALLNYGFANKYILDGTIRREGSSIFAPDHRFGTFYSVGMAWNMHNEEFMTETPFSLFKFRASYGLSGNSNFALNQFQRMLGLDADYNNQGAYYPSAYGNEELTWEKNNTLDIGMDFGLWNDRLSGQITYFNKKTFDLLNDVPLTSTSGFTTRAANAGEMTNKGVEILLSGIVVDNDDFKWNLSANLTTIDNEVTDLPLDVNGDYISTDTGTYVVDVGYPLYGWKMKSWAGVDPTNGDPLWFLDPENSDETTNDWSAAESVVQGGSPIPTYTGGLNSEFSYKNFFLNASVFFSGGNKVYQRWTTYHLANNLLSVLYYNGTTELLDAWTPENTQTDVPRMMADFSGMDAQNTSSRFLYDGDFIRLRNIEFGYDVPSQWLETVGIDGMRLSVSGVNLYTWVKDDGLKYDPEVRTNGFTRLTSPPVKQFTFNVNIQF